MANGPSDDVSVIDVETGRSAPGFGGGGAPVERSPHRYLCLTSICYCVTPVGLSRITLQGKESLTARMLMGQIFFLAGINKLTYSAKTMHS